MSGNKPVVVYGASGFSGRLVVEYLREYNVPFIAAGRNRARIEAVMKQVPGIETAQFEIAEVGNSVEELAKLFAGAKVVCNTVGPFIYSGPLVIEACLKAGCHYLDISGEQEWIRQVATKWSGPFAERKLLAAPATAFMSAPSDAAARLCLEKSNNIDTLETVTLVSRHAHISAPLKPYSLCFRQKLITWSRINTNAGPLLLLWTWLYPDSFKHNSLLPGAGFLSPSGSKIIPKWQT